MSKFDENMKEVFAIASTEKVIEGEVIQQDKPQSKMETTLQSDLSDDYKQVRENLQDIVDKGLLAIDNILHIAKESEHPRAFEVAATMIKNVTEANEKLITLQKQMRDITGQKDQQQVNVDKAIFVGSTTELLKAIKSRGND